MKKYIIIIYLENTNWEESDKIQHDYVFFFLYISTKRQSKLPSE